MDIQPLPPGPIEKRVRQLEDMIRALINKLPAGGPPIDPADFPLGPREGKEHPGECEDAHPDQDHDVWAKQSK
jgi:hypothetical protein